MNKNHFYSPLPIEAYRLPDVHDCEVRMIERADNPLALWNAFWLSNATVDTVPDAGRGWWRTYRPVNGLLKSLISDLAEDEQLEDMLTSHPMMFAEWFEAQQHRDMHTYFVAGAQEWVERVSARAAIAIDRLVSANPPIIGGGIVLPVGRRA